MKIGEWDALGKARALLQRQMGDLGATELATHVTINPENGRMHVLVATDIGLADYSWAPAGSAADTDWYLRGTLYRWRSVRGVRLQTDAQIGEDTSQMQSIWRLVGEDPKIELAATGTGTDREAVDALLSFAHACMERAGG
ncbi:MAG TPA: hypothetical protein VFX74_06150 [Candidatus Limnocylindria bacterium]|nr:hypothetical protein [Candidatus Limnocylindria bacterium]